MERQDVCVNASAFQDHLMRSLDLNLGTTLPRTRQQAVAVTASRGARAGACVGAGAGGGRRRRRRRDPAAPQQPQPQQEEFGQPSAIPPPPGPGAEGGGGGPWTCESCTYINRESDGDRCAVCGTRSRHRQREAELFARPVEGTGPSRPSQAPSLAERRGLVAVTPVGEDNDAQRRQGGLTREEWETVEHACLQRGESSAMCPICMDPFADKQQVLLSCSHVFHISCLQAFERFVRDAERNCPICRKVQYHKRLTTTGSTAYRMKCVLQVQCAWRAALARRALHKQRRRFYFSQLDQATDGSPGAAQKKREFVAQELSACSDRLVRIVHRTEDSLDNLMAECDASLVASRETFSDLPARLLQRLEEETARDVAAAAAAAPGAERHAAARAAQQRASDVAAAAAATAAESMRSSAAAPAVVTTAATTLLSAAEWHSIAAAARGRDEKDCPICMQGLHAKAVAVTSCAHLFHSTCLHAFENFAPYEIATCPVCREEYERRELAELSPDPVETEKN